MPALKLSGYQIIEKASCGHVIGMMSVVDMVQFL